MASALGSLSLPSVSTPFDGAGASMMPTVSSNLGNLDNVKKMSPVESMQEVFFDIRDGINGLSESIKNQTGLLNNTLLGVITTLTNIGNIAKKDLNLEKTQTKIDIENKNKGDFDDSVKTPVEKAAKGPGILSGLKDAFGSLFDKLTPKSTLGKLGMIAAAGALLMMNFDAVAGAIGKAAKFFKETIVPKAKVFYEDMKETTIGVFDGLFEKDKGLFPLLGKGLKDIADGFKENDPVKKLKGMKTIFVDGTIKSISVIGDGVFGTLNAAAKAIGMDTPGLRELQLQFRNLPETINAFVARSIEKSKAQLKEITDTNSLPEATLVAARQIYDDLGAPVLNSLNKLLGITFKPVLDLFGDDYYKSVMSADFSTKSVKKSIKNSFEGMSNAFTAFGKSINTFANEVIDSANETLPMGFEIDRIPVKDDKFEIQTLENMEKAKLISPQQYEPGGFMYERYIKQREKVIAINPSVVEPISELEKVYGVNFSTGDLIDGSAKIKKEELKGEKIKKLQELTNKFNGNVAPNNNIIADNKQITTTNNSSNTIIATSQRVESLDSSSNALLQYFRT
tara:strand:+ start:39 stop:1739 length:1701 start_codon:yes stop_codon:yes gene_type:complete